jgi:hypothetical protein
MRLARCATDGGNDAPAANARGPRGPPGGPLNWFAPPGRLMTLLMTARLWMLEKMMLLTGGRT